MPPQKAPAQPAACPASDPFWKAAADFALPRLIEGDRLIAPAELAPCFPGHACDSWTGALTGKYQWVFLHKGMLREAQARGVLTLCFVMTPVFYNEVFVVFTAKNRLRLQPPEPAHYQSLLDMLEEEIVPATFAQGNAGA